MNFNIKNLNWNGRILEHENIFYFDYSASGFSFILKGKSAVAKIISDATNWDEKTYGVLGVFITENPQNFEWTDLPSEPNFKFTLSQDENTIQLFNSELEKTVLIRVVKLSEAAFGFAGLKSLEVKGEILNETKKSPQNLKLEFIGDSITCGYGIEGVFEKDVFTTQHERADKSYAFLTAKSLNAKILNCCWSGIGVISNYVDPETVNLPENSWLMPPLFEYTDKSLSKRLKIEPEIWNEKNYSPDIVIINLGTNDSSFTRNIEERKMSFVSSYRQLLESVHRRSPNAKICCCLGVMGQDLCESVKKAIELFKQDFWTVKIKFVEFPIQNEKNGIATDWHPSQKTHELMSEHLVKELKSF